MLRPVVLPLVLLAAPAIAGCSNGARVGAEAMGDAGATPAVGDDGGAPSTSAPSPASPPPAAPSSAAAKTSCAATFDASDGDGVATFPDWKSAYESARKQDASLPPWSGAPSLRALCGEEEDHDEGKPCLWHLPGAGHTEASLLVPTSGGKVVRHLIGEAGGQCGCSVKATIVGSANGIVQVHVRTEEGRRISVTERRGRTVPCTGDGECLHPCGATDVTFGDVLVDSASGRRLLSVSREAHPGGRRDPLRVSRSGRRITVKGAGCDRTITLPGR